MRTESKKIQNEQSADRKSLSCHQPRKKKKSILKVTRGNL